MMKFIFWCLLGMNALLFALGQGYLGHANEHEPARIKNQLNRDKLRLISAPEATPAHIGAGAGAGTGTAAAKPPELIACTEIGNFTNADAARFEARLAPLALGPQQSQYAVPGQKISGYMVYLPAQDGKQGADKKAGELTQLGVTNYFIMADDSALRWAISLGVFKSETGAQKLLTALIKQGVHGARIAPRMSASKQLAFQLRDLDAPTKTRLDQIKAAFPDQEMRSCN